MTRGRRVALSLSVVAVAVLTALGIGRIGSLGQGPLDAALRGAGSWVRAVESDVIDRVRGPGRKRALAWFASYRDSPGPLRDPERLAALGSPLLGVYDGRPWSLEGVLEVERAIGTKFPLVHVYTAWGDKPEQRFPLRLLEAVRSIGSVPVITWEPWLTDFENRLHPHLPLRTERDRGGLAAIARGEYDFYVDAWAREAARYGSPILLRFGHEMNDPYRYPWGPQNNQPWDYVHAWNHVVGRFRAAGADNVVWIWSPHLGYEGWEWFYPGDETVDWVATGVLNYGTVARWSEWWTFEEIFGRHYPAFSAYGKPIMIAELGSLAVGGDRAAWFRSALADLPERYPGVRAVLFFEVASDATVTYQALDWTVADDPPARRAVAEAIAGWPRPGEAASSR